LLYAFSTLLFLGGDGAQREGNKIGSASQRRKQTNEETAA